MFGPIDIYIHPNARRRIFHNGIDREQATIQRIVLTITDEMTCRHAVLVPLHEIHSLHIRPQRYDTLKAMIIWLVHNKTHHNLTQDLHIFAALFLS